MSIPRRATDWLRTSTSMHSLCVTCALLESARAGSLTMASHARSVNVSGFMPWLELMERRDCDTCRALERHHVCAGTPATPRLGSRAMLGTPRGLSAKPLQLCPICRKEVVIKHEDGKNAQAGAHALNAHPMCIPSLEDLMLKPVHSTVHPCVVLANQLSGCRHNRGSSEYTCLHHCS